MNINEIIVRESKIIQDIFNNELLLNFNDLHNIPHEHNKLSAKQELIAKRAFFASVKKKYAMHITNLEGVDVDDYEIKGFVMRRSDYPSITKVKLGILLDYILKDEIVNFKKIAEFITTTREEIRLLCVAGSKEIAKPVTFSKELDVYKVIPSHVRAMEVWNDVVYDNFKPGMKGYLYNVHGIDQFKAPVEIRANMSKHPKFDRIVIPMEELKLPEYFIPDVDKLLDFAWDSRVSEFLEPIMDKIKVKQNIKKNVLTTW